MKVTHEEQTPAIQLPGRSIKVLVNTDTIGSEHITFAVAEIPEGSSIPWHMHQDAEEIIYVLQGVGSAESETETQPVHPGTVLYMEPGSKHRIFNKGKGEVKLLCSFSPPIKIEPPK